MQPNHQAQKTQPWHSQGCKHIQRNSQGWMQLPNLSHQIACRLFLLSITLGQDLTQYLTGTFLVTHFKIGLSQIELGVDLFKQVRVNNRRRFDFCRRFRNGRLIRNSRRTSDNSRSIPEKSRSGRFTASSDSATGSSTGIGAFSKDVSSRSPSSSACSTGCISSGNSAGAAISISSKSATPNAGNSLGAVFLRIRSLEEQAHRPFLQV